MFQNINGLHSNGQNMHKLKENSRIFRQEKPDIQVYLETGINTYKDAVIHDNLLTIDVENKIQNKITN